MSILRAIGALALGLTLALGCSGRSRDGGPPADRPSPPFPSPGPSTNPAAQPVTASKEKRVYDVASTSDLLNVQSKYLEQAAAGYEGRFEVRFTASISPTSWSLAPEAGKDLPAIELVLSGASSAASPISVPVPRRLAARSVHLENLVLTGPVGLSSEIEVRTSFTMLDSAVIDGRGTVPASQAPYLAIRAHAERGKKEPATLTIERSWFLRNWQADQSQGAALLGLEHAPQDGGFFGAVRIRDTAFLGNAFSTELRLAYALDVVLERCLFYRTWPAGSLIGAELVESVRVEDSLLIIEDLAHLGHLGEDVPPIHFSGTRVFAKGYTAKTPLPAAAKLDRADVAPRSAIDAKLAPLDAAAKLPLALPPADLRAKLLQSI